MQPVKRILVVIANSSLAKFYLLHGPSHLVPLVSLTHPESRLKEQDLVSDHEGYYDSGSKKTPRAVEPHESKKETERKRFAKEIIKTLETLAHRKKVHEICICASPHFMGDINKIHHLEKHYKITEVDKDFTHYTMDDLIEALKEADLSFVL